MIKPMINKLLRGEEVGQVLSLSKAFVYRLIADGRIPAVRMGRSVRVRPEDLDRFIRESVTQGNNRSFGGRDAPNPNGKSSTV
jgi:excisionase family DNA binding protein